MTDCAENGRLELAPQILERSFNREPISLDHNLHQLGMFDLDSLQALAKKYEDHGSDFMVATSASAPDQTFRSVKTKELSPHQAIGRLKSESVRILLKRPQNYDSRFQTLLDDLVGQVISQSNELRDDRIVRLESSIFLTSAKTLTPFHFDPSAVFFFQIAGEKIYHVYPPAALTEPEMEQFYFRGLVDIAQVDLNRRDPKLEHIFKLSPGKGLHQPQNAPHWVETSGDISISYSFFFETLSARKINRTRGFNYYARKIGAEPAAPGAYPRLDALKADAMGLWIPCRKTLSAVRSATLGK
jgi:Cupin-like domain